MKRPNYRDVFDKLYDYYAAQQWWPADSSFEMMIGAILVQNTNWRNVEKALGNLKPFLKPEIINHLPMADLAELIRPSGFYNVKAKRIKAFMEWFSTYHYNLHILKGKSKFAVRKELLRIKGIGRETADVILLYALDQPVFVVDAYARRIFYRIGYDMPSTYDAFREQLERKLPNKLQLFNEYHALLVEHAKQHCKVKPICSNCPLVEICEQRI